MNTRAIHAAEGVIHAAQRNGTITAAGIAIALDAAGLLLSPEIAQDIASSAPAPSPVGREDVYLSPLHHDYRTSHDLPELSGGAA